MPQPYPISSLRFLYQAGRVPKCLLSSHKQDLPLKSSERTSQPIPTLSCHCDRCGAAECGPQRSAPGRPASPSKDDGTRHFPQTVSSASASTCWMCQWSTYYFSIACPNTQPMRSAVNDCIRENLQSPAKTIVETFSWHGHFAAKILVFHHSTKQKPPQRARNPCGGMVHRLLLSIHQ